MTRAFPRAASIRSARRTLIRSYVCFAGGVGHCLSPSLAFCHTSGSRRRRVRVPSWCCCCAVHGCSAAIHRPQRPSTRPRAMAQHPPLFLSLFRLLRAAAAIVATIPSHMRALCAVRCVSGRCAMLRTPFDTPQVAGSSPPHKPPPPNSTPTPPCRHTPAPRASNVPNTCTEHMPRGVCCLFSCCCLVADGLLVCATRGVRAARALSRVLPRAGKAPGQAPRFKSGPFQVAWSGGVIAPRNSAGGSESAAL